MLRKLINKCNSITPILFALILSCYCGSIVAQTASQFVSIPPLISDAATPNVMLVMSNDHELFKKAYTDYSDLDSDGVLDTTYVDTFDYTGYFDSNFCYSYSSISSLFEPREDISALVATNGHRCDNMGISGDWSGNFLNWATMTRADIIRTVLYGGKRSTDTATSGSTAGITVLERAFLPEDIHAFVKVFEGDTEKYSPYNKSAISMCNITASSSAGAPPLVRIAYGSWPQWSASEVSQCQFNGAVTVPGTGSSDRPSTYDLTLRVNACVATVDASSSRCKAYTDAGTGDVTYKPTGLLQEYGDNGNMNFGLITGSYEEKIQGGVLRKDILPLTGNASSSDNEIDVNSGRFINQGSSDAGIINTLNRFRIVNWDYSNNRYSDCDTHSISISTFKTSSSWNRQCRNWGNPLSEIYLEALRYFTGDDIPAGSAVPTSTFNTSDASQISALPQLNWNDPLNSSNACAACSIIVISTGLNSFDNDNLNTVSDLWDVAGTTRLSSGELDNIVDAVGDLEGISGETFLIGNNGTNNNNLCTAKTVNNLSDAVGLCPEIPAMEGAYGIAGLSYHAHISDLRNDYTGIQNVNTFSVALAESLPSFELDANGKKVSFVPTCQAQGAATKQDQGGWRECSLVDVIVESTNAVSGRFLIAWEDSAWGNDYDMDGISRLEYCIGDDVSMCPGQPANLSLGSGYSWSHFEWKTSGLTPDSVQFRLSVPQANAGNSLRFGYIISGVENQTSNTSLITNTPSAARSANPKTSGGKYIVYERLENGVQPFLLRQGNYTIQRLNSNSGNRIIYTEPAVYTASNLVTAGGLLDNPLWYAAKYGSYTDIDGDGTPLFNNDPLDTREWDNKDIQGNEIPDGIPDNYFPVRDPSQLITSLSEIFRVISERISSGTAAAVVANSSTGLGAVYQAYYHPTYSDDFDNTVAWGGVLHSMFIDESGRFREDNGNIGTLDGTGIDYVVDIFYDQTVTPNRTRFQRYTQTGTGPSATLSTYGSPDDLENIGSIWNARNQLAAIDQANLTTQRSLNLFTGEFSEPAQDKRYIFTFLDSVTTGTFGAPEVGEIVDFTATTFNPALNTNWKYLGLSSSTNATDLVNYIRGQDQPGLGWRSRRADLPGDGVDTIKYWTLGDIVHSSPLVVNPPNSRYDIIYGDATYAAFKEQYARRRQMVYVGGNDGMLHAFNSGIWDPSSKTFYNQQYNSSTGDYDVGQNHTLGAEMWAYVPMNLLPHLQWLSDPDYDHIYYLDAPPQSYDVNIFTPDATHPNGWGTILVAGMRLGGGNFPVDLDNNGSNETTMRSSIVILDITDPEKPPEVIAELNTTDLGFTTSAPTLVKSRAASATGSFAIPSVNRWLLVFGSGPDTLSTATSDGSNREAKLYAYDLLNRSMVNIHNNAQVPNGNPNGFFGDFLTVDWQSDYADDVIYVGTVEGTESAPEGRLKRIVLTDSIDMGLSNGTGEMSDVIDPNQPIVASPNIREDISKGERWLLFGTGRLFTRDDNNNDDGQAFYGVKEDSNYNTSSLTVSDLVDTTDIIVQSNGDISDGILGAQVTIDGTDLDTFNELNAYMDSQKGWVYELYDVGSLPSERVFSTSLVLGSTVVFSSYLPNVDLCTIEGSGLLNALNFRTGTAEIFGPFGEDSNGVSFGSISLGQGAPSTPTGVIRTGTDPAPDGSLSGGDLSIVTGSTTGVTESTSFSAAPGSGGRLSWEILDIPF